MTKIIAIALAGPVDAHNTKGTHTKCVTTSAIRDRNGHWTPSLVPQVSHARSPDQCRIIDAGSSHTGHEWRRGISGESASVVGGA
ncbi:MAG: hypothetical protein WBD31_18975 [Rubripirellula sp.]